jgi:hypothetical protein
MTNPIVLPVRYHRATKPHLPHLPEHRVLDSKHRCFATCEDEQTAAALVQMLNSYGALTDTNQREACQAALDALVAGENRE